MEMKRKILLSISMILIIFLCLFVSQAQATEGNNNGYLYLSDIDYIESQSRAGWGSILKDQANGGSKISVKVEGSFYTYDKGMWAHATSTIVYDISSYKDNYDYFTTYMGLNATAASSSNGVKFYVYTSKDGTNWELRTEENAPVTKPGANARYVEINIKEANYLKLVADSNGSNGNDHSVYADAKFMTQEYLDEQNNLVLSIDEYDQRIKDYSNKDLSDPNYELLLLQRELANNLGEYALRRFITDSEDNKNTIDWLMNDLENLRYYVLGGAPTGSYFNSLKELTRLLKEYKNDFNITEPISEEGIRRLHNRRPEAPITKGDLYKRMVITLSLTHSANVGLWMQPSAPENKSDSVIRYRIYKDMYNQGKFKATDNANITPWFESYNIEEMRYVMNTLLDDESIIWLNEYTQSKIDADPNRAWALLTPHSYIAYVWPNYGNEVYYSEENYDYFNELFSVGDKKLYDYGITRGTSSYKLYKLWMNFRNKFGTGCVCGGISKSGHCIRGVHGIASAVIGQPGHAALLYYTQDANGKGYWGIDNDVSGWTLSEKSERMPLGWGNASYSRGYSVVYVALAQEAMNDQENLEKCQKIIMEARVYANDPVKQEEIYRKALEVQPINIDAWYGLYNAYCANPEKSEDDFYDLAKEMAESLKYFPLPMQHLTNLIKPKMTSIENSYKFTLLQTRILTEGSKTPNNTADNYYVYQPSLTRLEANYLLGKLDKTIATFSFDGEDAGKIVLASRFDGNGVRWDYSLDGKQTWKEVSFDATEEHKLKLTEEEINSITSENDIYVHIVGVNYDEENLYKIDIQESAGLPSTLYASDLENRLIAATPAMQWKMNENDEWISYSDEEPDLTGDKTVIVKVGATGTYLASTESRTYNFTEDNQPETRKYIPVSHLSINAVSSEATGQGRHARNAIDANPNTNWHSAWDGSDRNKFIVIELDEAKNLTSLEYVPLAGGNGKIESAQILTSMDGENWTEVVSGTDWRYVNTSDVSIKSVDFEPTKAKYIKIVGKKTQSASGSSSFMVAAMFNLYENKTVELVGTYSFDGENGGKIALLDEYKTLNWKYSLNSGATWKDGTGEVHQLTTEEMNQINENDKIKIKFEGNETIYTINIKKGEVPNITPYVNDLENKLIGISNKDIIEWKYEQDTTWKSYSKEEPIVEGNKKLLVRAKATGIYTASDALEYQFTEDNDTNTEKYIPIAHLSIHDKSSQSIDSTRPFYAENVIDGNINTLWHTDFRYSIAGSKAFVSIKLDEGKSISALEFAQKLYKPDDPCYIRNAVVYVSENGIDWIEAGRIENCEQNEDFNKIRFDESIHGQYVKLEVEGYGIFAAVAMINIYEDTTVKKVADLSLSGENSGVIFLTDEFKGSNWSYSLDSGVTWKQGSSDEHQLTLEEIEQLNSDDKIRIRFENDSKEYTINIQKMNTPIITAYLNDLENRLIGIENTENLEWKIIENTQSRSINTNWTDFSTEEPIVEGNKKLLIRAKAKSIFTASDIIEYQFTEDNQSDTRKYVPVSQLSIAGFSAEDKAQRGAAVNAIDGNYNTRWLNSAAGTDNEKYIIVKFDSAIYLSAMDYVPHSENGKILSGVIEGSMDGENFTEIAQISGWSNNQEIKTIDFDEAVKVRYVKITGIETSYSSAKRHIGARMFNFYEDITKRDGIAPTAEVEYNITSLTNQDVVATLVNPSTNIIVLNNNGNTSYTFTENGEFTFEFEDSEGNKGKATAKVNWIRKTLPNATLTYDITDPTNKNVTVTVTFDIDGEPRNDVTILNNEGNNTYTFEENGEFTFEFRGPYGNEGTITAEVDWICKTLPNATFEYDITETTNQPVTVTVTFDRENVTILNNSGLNTYTFEENGEFTFEFRGPYGNEGIATATVDWIDKTIPFADITYDYTELTNRDVTATLSSNEEITITNNNGSATYTFTENGEFTFEFVNELGNSGTATAKVDWIDKKVPNAIISYNIIESTNQKVVATINFDKENVTVTNNNGNKTYDFIDNGEFIFEFVDNAGNAGTATAEVTWIDKTLPIATITYSTTNLTNQNVVATINFDKENVIVKDGNTHTFTQNGEYTFEFTGPAGNKGVAIAEVTWIDKVVPEPTLVYNTMEPTNKNVTVGVAFDKDNVRITNNGGINQYIFEENGEFTFEYMDEAGNSGSVKAIVNWIDKVAPSATVSYDITNPTNEKVIASLENASEEITITNNDGNNTYTFTRNGEFTFEFVDRAGNVGEATARVTWIDKRIPVVTITYSTTEPTDKEVIATITFDKENVTVEGGNTYTFTENGEYTFDFVDEAGNMGMATAIVDWIIKEPDVPNPPEEDPSFEMILNSSKETLNSGEEFEIDVIIDNLKNIENGILALGGQFEYDEEVLEILEIIGQDNWNIDNNSFNENNFKFVTENGEYINQSTNIMKIKLKVKESIEESVDTTFRIKSIIGSNAEIDIKAKDAELDLHIDKFVEEEPKISSDKYIIKDNTISRVMPKTTLSEFKNNVTANRDFTIIDESGNAISDDDIIKTGMKLKLTEEIEFTLVVIGDINKDGVITITDLANLKLHIIEMEILTGDSFLAADIDGNGEVTITDLAQLKMIIIGLMEL